MKKTLLISLCIVITLSAVFFVFLSNQPPDPDILYAAEPTQDTPSSPDIASIYAYTTYEPTESDYETPTPQALEYIPDVPTYKTKLQALISQANHQYQLAATPGAHIQSGRHHATDIQTLLGAIHHAQTILETPNTTDEDIQQIAETLHQAINTFHHTIIDTRNHYRPFLPTIAQGQYTPEKRHLRAAWIATVLNIDWPSVDARGATPAHVDLQKYELRTRFHELAELGFNAVIFQISPTGDAFFNSAMSPWSAWLTGETNFTGELLDSTGAAFDPLAYAIQLAQAHNMEFHAWFNPYRITHTLEQYAQITLSSTGQYVTDLAQIRQEWSQIPGTAFYLFGDYVKLGENRYVVDPAAPGVKDWIVRRVLEVVENYDIDAVHFDDYFYPAGFPITDTFARYNPQNFPNTTQGQADWRRHNTEMMIRDVGEAVKAAAPWVKFGISPGGVWKSAAEGNTGLDGGAYNAGTGSASTTTWSNYHSSYADTRRWVIENWVDYLTPQIYWDWDHSTAPFGVIAEWWGRLFYDFGPHGALRNSQGEYTNAQLFLGLGLYRMDNLYRTQAVSIPNKWRNAAGFENEGMRTFLRQEAYSIGNPNISGSMIFTQNHMRPGRGNGMRDTMETLRETMWRYPALVPTMPHLGGIAPHPPVNALLDGNALLWEDGETSRCQMVATRYFVVYRSQNERIDLNNPANIAAIVPANGEVKHQWEFDGDASQYHFVITAVNRLHDESAPAGIRR